MPVVCNLKKKSHISTTWNLMIDAKKEKPVLSSSFIGLAPQLNIMSSKSYQILFYPNEEDDQPKAPPKQLQARP